MRFDAMFNFTAGRDLWDKGLTPGAQDLAFVAVEKFLSSHSVSTGVGVEGLWAVGEARGKGVKSVKKDEKGVSDSMGST
ncbi:hypothetical protein SLA2020_453180 [Shorea laevis]